MNKLFTIITLILISKVIYAHAPVPLGQYNKFGTKGIEARNKIVETESIKIICEDANVQFVGIENKLVYFNEPQTKSTITCKIEDFNTEKVKQLCEAKIKQFKNHKTKTNMILPVEFTSTMKCQAVCNTMGLQFIMAKEDLAFFNVPDIKTTLYYPVNDFTEKNIELYIYQVKYEEWFKKEVIKRLKQKGMLYSAIMRIFEAK